MKTAVKKIPIQRRCHVCGEVPAVGRFHACSFSVKAEWHSSSDAGDLVMAHGFEEAATIWANRSNFGKVLVEAMYLRVSTKLAAHWFQIVPNLAFKVLEVPHDQVPRRPR